MTQNRDAPAYQVYPAAMLANLHYRLLTLSERGLLQTLRFECWVNRSMPADAPTLAVILGLERDEVEAALPKLKPFFAVQDGWLRCPELEDYRAHLEHRKQRQSEGGKEGAAIANSKKKGSRSRAVAGSTGNSTSNPASNPQGTQRVQGESLVQSSTAQNSTATACNQGGVDLSTPAWED